MKKSVPFDPALGLGSSGASGGRTAAGIFIGRSEVLAGSIPAGKLPLGFVRYAREPIVAVQESSKDKIVRDTSRVLPPDGKAIQSALQKINFRPGPIALALSPSFCVTRYFEIPYLRDKELKQAVHYEARRYIPYKLEETCGDFFSRIRTDASGKKIISVSYTAAKKETVVYYHSLLRQVQARAVYVEPVFLSLVRTLAAAKALPGGGESAGLIFIEGAQNVNMTLLHEGIIYLSHDWLLAEDPAGNQSRFFHEIKTSSEYAQRSWGVPLPRHFYLAGSGDLESWLNFLSHSGSEAHYSILPLPVESPLAPSAAGQAAVPAGLALRLGKPKGIVRDLQLLPSEVRGLNTSKIKKGIILETVLFFVLFAAARFFFLDSYAADLQGRVAGQQPRAASLSAAYSGQSFHAVQSAYEGFERRLRAIDSFDQKRLRIYKKMKVIGVSKPSSVWLKRISYSLFGTRPRRDDEGTMPERTPELALEGFCYLGNPEGEVAVVHDWAAGLGKNESFTEGLKGLTVSEIKRSTYLTSDVTEFQVASKNES